MTSDRKSPGVAFWTTVVVVCLLVAYPLSMGPYWWLCHQVAIPESIGNALDAFYDPVWEALWRGPDWLQEPIRSYLDWWTRDQPPPPL